MSRASHQIPAGLLLLFTVGVCPPTLSAAPGLSRPREPADLETAVLPAAGRSWRAVADPTTLAPDTLTGTVSYVHVEDATVHVITGVQFALRVVEVRVIADTRIEKAGEAVAMEELVPGDIVQIDYRATPEGDVADAIRVVSPSPEGGAP